MRSRIEVQELGNKTGKKYFAFEKVSWFDAGTVGAIIECVCWRCVKMGEWCLSYNRTKLDETQ